MNERLDKIEERLAFQEMSTQELSDEIYRQQQQVDKLTGLIERLNDKLQTLADDGGTGSAIDEKPPHY